MYNDVEEHMPKSQHSDHSAEEEVGGQASSAAGGRTSGFIPVEEDDIYSGLREENRVVMRHEIALNLSSFRAAPEDFRASTQARLPTVGGGHSAICFRDHPEFQRAGAFASSIGGTGQADVHRF